MKRLPFFCLLILFSSLANAQFMQIAEGPVFADTIPGFSKILQMKNNSTMFFHINFSKGLNIHVYDAQYKGKTETNIEPAYGSLKAGNIEGIFEISGDAVVMISDVTENGILLYRLIIDGITGKLKDEKQIASLKRISLKKGDLKIAAPAPGIYVRKDPNSENYAVALMNSIASDSSKRIEIVLYGNNNKEISRAYSPQLEKYKYLQYVDMALIGSDKAALLVYGYNIKQENDKEGELIFAGLDKGATNVVINELNFSNDQVIERGITRYDPQTKRMLLLTTDKIKSDSNKIRAYLDFIDPFTRKLLINKIVPGEKLKNKYSEIFGKNADYTGIPQNLFVNSNRTCTIIFEEMETAKDTPHTSIKNIAVVTYDDDGVLKSSYFIPMDHYIPGIALPSFYQSGREITGQQSLHDNQYKSNVYISDGHTSFVLLNDTGLTGQPDNITPFKEIRDADAFYYPLAGNVAVPKRGYVFGKPADKYDHKAGVFTVYDYDKANNLLITLKAEKEGPHPGVKLVWLEP